LPALPSALSPLPSGSILPYSFLGRAEGLLAILFASPVVCPDNHAALALTVDAKHGIPVVPVVERAATAASSPLQTGRSRQLNEAETRLSETPMHRPAVLPYHTYRPRAPSTHQCVLLLSHCRPQHVRGTVAGRLGRGPETARASHSEHRLFQSLPLPLSWPCMQPHLSHAPGGNRRHVSFVQSLASTTFDIAPSIVGLTTQPVHHQSSAATRLASPDLPCCLMRPMRPFTTKVPNVPSASARAGTFPPQSLSFVPLIASHHCSDILFVEEAMAGFCVV